MDARPAHEATWLDYASTDDGVTRRCGHDMHLT
jgi:metal-dependent amidase/aminoacylase/carboxypeptidase family protein